ncbi:MAG: AAA family ATPase [Planctomycetaceae bacterium]|nr:AAA family ATPase [Planctomycetaceae bacterium]
MLKSLELFGFKSFADRTRFDLSTGITAVVGPNGSGKSNVVDAIKWILGDQSAKSLRGKEMTDVIFNGSASRKAGSMAEALLTFDNSGGLLEHDSTEVQIGRRLWRTGDSEYLINREVVRRKDILQLLMGTGAGSSAYCIIEQGRVDQILQSNAASRRAVFEEAAGISRFKARKVEATRKLERVEQNLLRLTDIVDEVEARLTTLRSQAAKAARYRETSTELKSLWLGLAADDFRLATTKREQLEVEREEAEARSEELGRMHSLLEAKLAGQDAEIAEIDDQLRAIDRAAASTREELVARQMTVRHEAARSQELESELRRTGRQSSELAAREQEARGEFEHHQRLVEEAEAEVASGQARLDTHREREQELAATLEQQQQLLESVRAQLQQQTEQLAELDGIRETRRQELQAAEIARDATIARLGELNDRLTACREEFEAHEEQHRQASETAEAADERLAERRAERSSMAGEYGEVERGLSRLREERSAAQARRHVLEDLEKRQEGMGIGVREILHRARTSDQPPWNRIYGSVAELLEVDLEDAALLEVALDTRAQLLVMSETESLVEYLRTAPTQISGRVGFLSLKDRTAPPAPRKAATPAAEGYGPHPLTPVETNPPGESAADTPAEQPRTEGAPAEHAPAEHATVWLDRFQMDIAALPDLSQEPGVCRRADRLVRLSHGHPQLAAQLLADTWIVETLDDALQLAKSTGRGCRFVTLQGELLDRDGTINTGLIHSESSLVSRRSELRRLSHELEMLDRRISREEDHLVHLGESLSGCDFGVAEAEKLARGQAAELTRITAERDAVQRRLKRLEREQETLEAQLARQSEAEAGLRESLDAVTAERGAAVQAAEQQRKLQSETEQQLTEIGGQLQQNRQKSDVCRAEVGSLAGRLEDYRRSLERLRRDRQERQTQLAEVSRQQAAARERLSETRLMVLNTSAQLAELALVLEQSERGGTGLTAEKAALRRNRSNLMKEEAALRKEQREFDEIQHRADMQLRELTHQEAALRERMEEEYQVDLDELVREGASAFRMYLEEKRDLLARQLKKAAGSRGDNPSSTGAETESETEIGTGNANAEASPSEETGQSAEAAEAAATDETDEGTEPAAAEIADSPTAEDSSAEEGSSGGPDEVESDAADSEAAAAAETGEETETDGEGDFAELLSDPDSELTFEDVREELEGRVSRLRRKLKMMGSVNTDSLNDLDELETRFNHLSMQLQDLVEARSTLEDIIRRINAESRRLFVETFDAIRSHFQELFRKAFGGGNGDMVLEDPDDVLECGIDIVARPPGKALKSISLMSGGEKTLTAFALLLAMFRSRPSPFCVLDEVDAALDEANVGRLLALLEEFRSTTQFVVITHRKPTMTIADVLYGVTMEQSGVSKRMSVRFDDISDNGEFTASADSDDGTAQAA